MVLRLTNPVRSFGVVGLVSVGLLILAPTPTIAFTLADSINADKSPSAFLWNPATEVGWTYTPGRSYELAGIYTKFLDPTQVGGAPAALRSVRLEFFAGVPGDRATTLLRSAEFVPVLGVFSGAMFEPLSLQAGRNYFVGFRNVLGLGVNVTDDPDAIALSPLHFGLNNDGSYRLIDNSPSQSFTSKPILQFAAPDPTPVPTPALLPGLIGLGVGVWRKRKA